MVNRMVDHDDVAEVQWAPRVNPSTIRRLYEIDARGIADEDLIDEVGYALFRPAALCTWTMHVR